MILQSYLDGFQPSVGRQLSFRQNPIPIFSVWTLAQIILRLHFLSKVRGNLNKEVKNNLFFYINHFVDWGIVVFLLRFLVIYFFKRTILHTLIILQFFQKSSHFFSTNQLRSFFFERQISFRKFMNGTHSTLRVSTIKNIHFTIYSSLKSKLLAQFILSLHEISIFLTSFHDFIPFL